MESNENLDSKSENTNSIKPISRDTIHRICSGQVVLNLATAVKELIENSIDAGATIVNVTLKEYGSVYIEVSDNGGGVQKENFQNLTLKHYTSKLRDFHELEHISTLGFRGEALSSLCALSQLEIITRHESSDCGTKIKYDSNGRIVDEMPAAREIGTTVIINELFSTLPVRRKEFLKNLKRDFNKMCQILYSYCLVCKNIKFNCVNISKGQTNTIVQTEGSKTVRENIINVFGAKQLSSLIEIDLIEPTDDILEEFNIKSESNDCNIKFEFLISSVLHGNGRSTTDRQFYFINSRPCDPTKLIKLINSIYKQFNNQSPFVYLNVENKTGLIDVNVTPDKRQIFVQNEKQLMAIIKASLLDAFKNFPSTFKVQNLENSRLLAKDTKNNLKRNLTEIGTKKGSILERFQKKPRLCKSEPFNQKSEDFDEEFLEISGTQKNLDSFIEIACEIVKTPKKDNLKDVSNTIVSKSPDKSIIDETNNHSPESPELIIPNIIKNKIEVIPEQIQIKQKKSECETPKILDPKVILKTDKNLAKIKKPSITWNTNLDDIKKACLSNRTENSKNETIVIKFRSDITPASNKSAENELEKQFKKDDFKKMDIIGQFNLAFIIAKLNDDLFIIDQHACDEKYNFEQLQAHTIIEKQVLVNPQKLELTAGNESLLIENLEIFKKNGFSFNIDSEAPCTKKVSLTAVPMSKDRTFGKEDIDELLLMLQDFSHRMCRPSKMWSMFASRACRMSVMVGTSLSMKDMRKLIDHMGDIEQPWNCPHGRPTMRHLINLNLIE